MGFFAFIFSDGRAEARRQAGRERAEIGGEARASRHKHKRTYAHRAEQRRTNRKGSRNARTGRRAGGPACTEKNANTQAQDRAQRRRESKKGKDGNKNYGQRRAGGGLFYLVERKEVRDRPTGGG